MNIVARSRLALVLVPLASVALRPADATAQVQAPPGVVTTRTGLDGRGQVVPRSRMEPMRAETRAFVRRLITARYPRIVQGTQPVGSMTFVLDANGSVVSSSAHAPSPADTARVNIGAVFFPSAPTSMEVGTFAAGEVSPGRLRVVVISLQ